MQGFEQAPYAYMFYAFSDLWAPLVIDFIAAPKYRGTKLGP